MVTLYPFKRTFFKKFFVPALLCCGVPSSLSAHLQSADTIYTYVWSEGIGNIAVRIECPASPRYREGAPVVVEVGTWFVPYNEFHRVNDTKQIGAVTVAYLWPGRLDAESGIKSDGEYDYGGPVSLSALKDVIRFASGLITDVNEKRIADVSTVPVLTENIGLFASSHSGVVATNVLAYFGKEIPSVKYLVGRENPTRDEMYPLELGYFDGSSAAKNRMSNPFYDESTYSSDSVIVDYSTVGWYQPTGEQYGRPYFAAKDALPQYILANDKIPKAYNDKRYYSRAITRALLKNGALSLANWPAYLATPAETDAFWPYRITVHNYSSVADQFKNLKVMLVFARYDHVLAPVTKPHIHQAWDGFYKTCGFWVRMNPDRSYSQSVDPNYGLGFPDNKSNREPSDWNYIEDWAFPPAAQKDMWLASVAEMADRTYKNDWRDDLDSVHYPVLIDSASTPVQDALPTVATPKAHRLLPCFPNPFNSRITVPIRLLHQGRISLTLHALQGERIATVFNGSLQAGDYSFAWNAEGLPSGVYICRLGYSGGCETQKFLFMK